MAETNNLLTAILDGPTDADQEEQIITLLRDASADELNELLAGIDVDRLFSSIDNRLLGPDRRTELTQLLTRDRVAELDLSSLAAVVFALQSGRTGPAAEAAIRDLMLSQRGAALTALKNQINMRTDVHDVEGLVYDDIDDDGIRTELLEHFAQQGAQVSVREAKVLSDIDDTAIARIHETRYPKGTLIPGILALYQALDEGPTGSPVSTGDLTFVTARPMDAFGLIEGHTRSALRQAGIANHSVLSGGFLSLRSHDSMADKKLENLEHYSAIYPEYDLVFIGDSGQGDPLVGAAMFERFPQTAKAVFIHDVVATPAVEREAQRAKGIHYVDTYVGAGLLALTLDLISRAGLDRIVAETLTGLDKVAWSSPDQEQAMRALVERDIAAIPPA